MTRLPVTEADLHAYADNALPAARAADVEAFLAEHPEEAARVAAYRQQNEALRRAYDRVLGEPVPVGLTMACKRRTLPLRRYAAVAAWLVLGGVIGWELHDFNTERRAESGAWARRAAIAHVIYSPEVRHPVEVGADQEAHLVSWLSKRLGAQIKVPHLGELGYSLVGGRMLPGERGPVAQFMYQDARGQRLTLYVRVNPDENAETSFRFAHEHGVGVYYWLDHKLGYAMSGEVERTDLQRVATAVYRQLNP